MPTSLEDRVEELKQLDLNSTENNGQLDIILKCLSVPLEWLSDVPTTEQLRLVQHPAWKRHVWHVFKNILPRWNFALSSSDHRQYLNDTLFLQQNYSADERVKAIMAQVSLPILLECLSAQLDATLDTLEIYASCLKLLSLNAHIYPLYAKYVPINNVGFFCSLLCSISGHLVNAFGIQFQDLRFNTEHEWYTDINFYSKLSKRTAENLTDQSIVFTQKMLSKIIRQGYGDVAMKSIYNIAKSSPDHWPTVFVKVEATVSPDKVTNPLLYHIKHDILPKTSIASAANDLAKVLFGEPSLRGDNNGASKEHHRVNEFLNTAVLRIAKSSWADESLARLVITTVIFAEGVTNYQLSPSGHAVLSKFVKRPIQTWSDPVFIKHASSRERLYIAMCILTLLAYLPDDEIKYNIVTETSLIMSVASYFKSGDKTVAQLGAVMAEAVTSRIDQDKCLDTGLLENNDNLKQMKQLIFTKDAFSTYDFKANEAPVDQSSTESNSENDDSEEDELDPDAEFCLEEGNENDSEEEFQAYHMEEESDDEGLKKKDSEKSHSKKPAFVRDLVRSLQDTEDPLKLEIGLSAAEQVIRQKANAGTELDESCTVLASRLISFPETYEIQDFRKLQQNALIALIVTVPEKVTEVIIDQLYDRNTSNGQKQIILGSISLAVRELAGWSEDSTTENTRNRLEDLEVSPRKLQLGTSVFVSRRMEVEKQHQQNIKKNKLSGLAGPVFFFPLLVGWWEGAQGRIKHWIGSDQILAERFIMTLNIILHSSTNTPDKRKIVREYFEFVSSMRYASHNSQGVKKALLLGINTIINVNYQGQEKLLFNDYNTQLSEIKDWLEAIMESSSEQSLQQLAINILMRISQIALGST